MKKIKIGKGLFIGLALFLLLIVTGCWIFLGNFSSLTTNTYIYIDDDDTADSVFHKARQAGHPTQMLGMRFAAILLHYDRNIRPGRYEVAPHKSSLQLIRDLRNGRQAPVRLTIPNVRTMNDLAARLGRQLEADSAEWAAHFSDTLFCRKFGCDTATLSCLFLPNTYEVFWNVTPTQLTQRMKRESEAFWTDERLSAARKIGLTPYEVITLASIVDQETANNDEKPMIAGMYLNRLNAGMKLQADPTVKFALRRFDLRRILHEHLTVDSPYNTYRYEGLPPGPISIPAMSSIEATLHPAHHDYIYMCAKEDFSGTHRFAATYDEHLRNAKRYADALNERGIH